MKIYIDSEYKCHTTNLDGAFREFNVFFFEDKCQIFIEGYRFVPSGESWTRYDGKVFTGEMIAPWKDYAELDVAQRKYELAKLSQYENEKNDLNISYTEGVNSI